MDGWTNKPLRILASVYILATAGTAANKTDRDSFPGYGIQARSLTKMQDTTKMNLSQLQELYGVTAGVMNTKLIR